MYDHTTASQTLTELSAKTEAIFAEAERLRAALLNNIQESRRLFDQLDEVRMSMSLGTSDLRGANLQDIETAAVLSALENSAGNRTRAARVLGISVRTIQRKLKSLGWLESADGDGECSSPPQQRAS